VIKKEILLVELVQYLILIAREFIVMLRIVQEIKKEQHVYQNKFVNSIFQDMLRIVNNASLLMVEKLLLMEGVDVCFQINHVRDIKTANNMVCVMSIVIVLVVQKTNHIIHQLNVIIPLNNVRQFMNVVRMNVRILIVVVVKKLMLMARK
jgi:hypothetical protein